MRVTIGLNPIAPPENLEELKAKLQKDYGFLPDPRTPMPPDKPDASIILLQGVIPETEVPRLERYDQVTFVLQGSKVSRHDPIWAADRLMEVKRSLRREEIYRKLIPISWAALSPIGWAVSRVLIAGFSDPAHASIDPTMISLAATTLISFIPWGFLFRGIGYNRDRMSRLFLMMTPEERKTLVAHAVLSKEIEERHLDFFGIQVKPTYRLAALAEPLLRPIFKRVRRYDEGALSDERAKRAEKMAYLESFLDKILQGKRENWSVSSTAVHIRTHVEKILTAYQESIQADESLTPKERQAYEKQSQTLLDLLALHIPADQD